MKLAILFITLATACNAMTEKQANTIVDTIFHIEGGYKTKWLYGVKSILVKNETEARKVCLRTVINQEKRWRAAGMKEDYLKSLSLRYCPILDKADTKGLNKNWLRNLRSKLPKDFKIQ